MSKAARQLAASAISQHARHYNKPGRILVDFVDINGSTLGSINMSGRELKKLEPHQLKSIPCDSVSAAIFRFNGSSSVCQIVKEVATASQ